jgi:hypothetical protein
MFLHQTIIYLQWGAADGASYMVMMYLLANAQLDVVVPAKYPTAITLSAVTHHNFPLIVCATSQFMEEVTVDGPA